MVFIKRHLALLQIMSISLILFVACKPGVPNRYIQPSELGDILYEYHLAEGITSLKNDTTALYYYKNNILKKHNVTSAEFDSSMVYYLRHADELKKDIRTPFRTILCRSKSQWLCNWRSC